MYKKKQRKMSKLFALSLATTLILPLTLSISQGQPKAVSPTNGEYPSEAELYQKLSHGEKSIFDNFTGVLRLNPQQRQNVLLYKNGFKSFDDDRSIFGRPRAFVDFLGETIGADVTDLRGRIMKWFLDPENKGSNLTITEVQSWLPSSFPKDPVSKLVDFVYKGPYILFSL